MITLYHSPFTRSHLIRFALEEAALPHEIVRLDATKGEHKAPAYLAVNPLGQLPALKDGAVTICEAAAICLYVGDKAGPALAPPVGSPERATYYHWVVFGVATQLMALSKIAMNTRFLPEAARSASVADEGRRQWADVAAVLSRAVAERRHLLGDPFTMADVVVGGALWLASLIGVLDPHAELRAYYGRVADRPAFQRAFADAATG